MFLSLKEYIVKSAALTFNQGRNVTTKFISAKVFIIFDSPPSKEKQIPRICQAYLYMYDFFPPGKSTK